MQKSPRLILEMESYIHDGVLKDLIAAHLYATTRVADNEEVLELTVGPPDEKSVRTIRYKTIKDREVEVIIHS